MARIIWAWLLAAVIISGAASALPIDPGGPLRPIASPFGTDDCPGC